MGERLIFGSFSTIFTAHYVDNMFAAYLTLIDFQNTVRNLGQLLKKQLYNFYVRMQWVNNAH